MRATFTTLWLLTLAGCAGMPGMVQEKSPGEVYGRAPDAPLACTLLRASRCAYAVVGDGEFTTTDESYAACAPDWLQKKAIADGGLHLNALVVALTPRSVVISYRGTLTPEGNPDHKQVISDWVLDADKEAVEADGLKGRLHRGFLSSVLATWQPLLATLREWRDKGLLEGKDIYVTGHSKGGAAAVIAAMKLAGTGFRPTAVYTFAGARAGDAEFAESVRASGLRIWRYENRYDVVPHLPPNTSEGKLLAALLKAEGVTDHSEYRDAGDLMYINWQAKLTAAYDSLTHDRLAWFDIRLHMPGVLSAVAAAHSSRAKGQYDSAICAGP